MALKGAVMLVIVAIAVQRYFTGCDGQFNFVPVPGSFFVPVTGQNFLPAPGQNPQFVYPATTNNQRMLTFVNNILFIKLLQRLVNRRSQSDKEYDESQDDGSEKEEEEVVPPHPSDDWWTATNECKYSNPFGNANGVLYIPAKTACQNLQARLPAKLRDDPTRTEVFAELRIPSDTLVWFGVELEGDGVWRWSDGEDATGHSIWDPNEPQASDTCAYYYGGVRALVASVSCERITGVLYLCEYCPNEQ